MATGSDKLEERVWLREQVEDGKVARYITVRARIAGDEVPEVALSRVWRRACKSFLRSGARHLLSRYRSMQGRRALDEVTLAEDAACYLRHVEAGGSKGDASRERGYSLAGFNRRLDRARAKGIYASNGKGKRGGELMEYGRELVG